MGAIARRERYEELVYDFLPELRRDPAFLPEQWNTWQPEKRVLARVIAQAIDDALAPRDCAVWEIESAHQFFYDGRLEVFCHFIDWRPSEVRAYYEKSRERVKNGEKWKRLSTIDSVQTPLVPNDLREDDEDDWDIDDERRDPATQLPDDLWRDLPSGGPSIPGGLYPPLLSTAEESLTA